MKEKFKDFQLEEYKNISTAHFETNKQIGIFFRYFLLIASAPALIFVWFGKDNPHFIDNLLEGTKDAISTNLFIGFFLLFISIIGVLSSFYLVSLKLDALLYARTVNGVRKFFFDHSELKNDDHFRVLPKQTNVPSYFDNHTFGILFYAIGLINAAYFSLGTRIIAGVGKYFFPDYLHFKPIILNYNIWWTIIVFIFFFFGHILYYNLLSKYRRINYLKSRIIGVDIDGVLNKHRETFCKIHTTNLNKKYKDIVPDGKQLKPEEINVIPVSLIEGKEVDRDDEFDVFNNPVYWEIQEIIENNVGKTIKELKNSFGYRINIHSYRPWPQYAFGHLIKSDNNLWRDKILKKITKEWLDKYGIEHNNLYIEKNSIDTSKRSFSIWGLLFNASKSSFKNRFYYTSKHPYRYFVEDDIDNAKKLAINCEYVFLIDQPYNKTTIEDLPKNIIRVTNWTQIKSEIKRLG
jgi:hypothetical protein